MIVYSTDFLEHFFPGHPESPERLKEIKKALDKKNFEFIEPKKATEKELLAVHSTNLVEELKARSKTGNGVPDNPFSKNTFETACLSAGAALTAAKHDKGFALARPPGHHAGKNSFSGFCYLNNVAIACASLLKKYSRILIVDFDLHLGQGTMEIFSGNDSFFYLSLHQDPATIYPWIQPEAKNARLLSLKPNISDAEYLKLFEKEFKKTVKEFEPELIAYSAGFDLHSADRFFVGNSLNISQTGTFNKIGSIINSAGKPGFAVLEGGYNLSVIGELAVNFLEGWRK